MALRLNLIFMQQNLLLNRIFEKLHYLTDINMNPDELL